MQKLLDGALTFRRHVFTAYRDLFQRLAQGQSPEVLFITCSDSRIVPNLITATDPGDLFIVRNVGNIVPPLVSGYGEVSEGAAIEFALSELRVRDIIVCGHSRCGAMKAALSNAPNSLPRVARWLRHVEPARKLLHDTPHGASPERSRADWLSQLNVLVQLQHLRTHPAVLEGLARGTVNLHGWFFEIESARLFTHDPEQEQFVPIEQAALSPQRRESHAG